MAIAACGANAAARLTWRSLKKFGSALSMENMPMTRPCTRRGTPIQPRICAEPGSQIQPGTSRTSGKMIGRSLKKTSSVPGVSEGTNATRLSTPSLASQSKPRWAWSRSTPSSKSMTVAES